MSLTERAHHAFDAFSGRITRFTGSSGAFILAFSTILVWAASGPFFDYSTTWQMLINTGTTVATFLMVFLIQHAQNKDAVAVHLKLNEMLAATAGASNRLVNIEDLSEAELGEMRTYYEELAVMTKSKLEMLESHTIEEARALREGKPGHRKRGAA